MYANLSVHVLGGPTYSAWSVDVLPEGGVLVYLDANEGTSAYPVPQGTLELPSGTPVTIRADW